MGRKRDKTDDSLQRLVITKTDQPTIMGGVWHVEKSSDENSIWCELRIGGFKDVEHNYQNPAMPFGGQHACWVLEIKRSKSYSYKTAKRMPSSAYEVDLSYYANGSAGEVTIPARTIFRGRAAKWPEAIRDVRYGAPIVQQMAWIGKVNFYGPEATKSWVTLRPFVVHYPWSDPREPNAKFSPFTLAGDFAYDPENDGAAFTCWSTPDAKGGRSLDTREVRRMCEVLDANAYLVETEHGWRVFHRRNMTEADPIDIDDWRARVIAGLAYEF